jgi:DNA polymerase-3 subunit epsilon
LAQGTAHRALDDSRACLDVALECFRRVGSDATIKQIIERQGKELPWDRFSMNALLEMERFRRLIAACRSRARVKLTYGGGSKKGLPRMIEVMGLVRSLEGDYLVGFCLQDQIKKRYYLNRILNVEAV